MRSRRVLILGGSSEASALSRALAGCPDLEAILSLAGRTAAPPDPALPTRVGGFGGIAGLVAFIRAARIAVVVDATHPFAAQMSRHAWVAGERSGVPVVRLTREAWIPRAGDCWREVADMSAAALALGDSPRRVFLTIGRQQLAAFAATPQHFYLVRTIEPPAADHGLPNAVFIQARGPFAAEAEERLMREHAIDVLVTKNSGGAASAGKLEAARRLGLPVILVRRPGEPGPVAGSVADALAAIRAHLAPPEPRGV